MDKQDNSTLHGLQLSDWAEEDRPREKMVRLGRHILSDAELLAILLGSGRRDLNAVDLAKLILREVNHDLNTLARMTISDLKKFKGIGDAKAITMMAALELGKRRAAAAAKEKIKISTAKDVYNMMKVHMMDLQHEELWVILLSRSSRVEGTYAISTGGLTATVADLRKLFKPALEQQCAALILVHNHPSGNSEPSMADVRLTHKVQQAGELLEIEVLDHIIFAGEKYYSFAENGLLHAA